MSRPNNHGDAALAREDVEDAKAGTSGVDLRGYAAELAAATADVTGDVHAQLGRRRSAGAVNGLH